MQKNSNKNFLFNENSSKVARESRATVSRQKKQPSLASTTTSNRSPFFYSILTIMPVCTQTVTKRITVTHLNILVFQFVNQNGNGVQGIVRRFITGSHYSVFCTSSKAREKKIIYVQFDGSACMSVRVVYVNVDPIF